jgi:protein-disulfide isomerase
MRRYNGPFFVVIAGPGHYNEPAKEGQNPREGCVFDGQNRRNDCARRFKSAALTGAALAAILLLAGPTAQAQQDPAKPAPAKATVTHATASAHQALRAPVKAYGTSGAPIKLEVFTDYECPSCRAFFEQTLRPLINDYVASGKVYLLHHDFPLQMHKYGYAAARWANAAAEAGQFGTVEAALYDNQASWSIDGNMGKYVQASMPAADFSKVQKYMQGCDNQTTAAAAQAALLTNVSQTSGDACALDSFINADHALGMTIPVQATPTYMITYKGQHLPAASGVVSWPILKQFFDSLLAQ